MHLELENRVVLVTGGTRGIGRTIVSHFLSEGCAVYFCARTSSVVKEMEEEWNKKHPGFIHGSAVDLSVHSQITEWVDNIAKTAGKIDVIVSNASALDTGDTAEAWRKMVEGDLLGHVTLVHAALPHLEKSKGNVVFISSVSQRFVDFTAPGPYGSIKAALVHYTGAMARTNAGKGVRFNSVSPGNTYVEDGVFGEIERGAPELFKEQLEGNPTGRMGKPEEVADAVLFLASARASFITGQNLAVDGARALNIQY